MGLASPSLFGVRVAKTLTGAPSNKFELLRSLESTRIGQHVNHANSSCLQPPPAHALLHLHRKPQANRAQDVWGPTLFPFFLVTEGEQLEGKMNIRRP